MQLCLYLKTTPVLSRGIYWWSEIKASSTEEVQISWPQCQGPWPSKHPSFFPIHSFIQSYGAVSSSIRLPYALFLPRMCLFVFSTGKIRCLSFKTVSDSSVVLPDWLRKSYPLSIRSCAFHIFFLVQTLWILMASFSVSAAELYLAHPAKHCALDTQLIKHSVTHPKSRWEWPDNLHMASMGLGSWRLISEGHEFHSCP